MAGLIYTATNREIPNTKMIGEINKELYGFIWGKSEKIKRHILINKSSEGGIGMLDVQSHFESLKAAWIPRLISQKTEHHAHWTEIPAYHLNTLGQNMYIIETNAYEGDTINKLPKFYQEVVGAYCKAKNIPYNV